MIIDKNRNSAPIMGLQAHDNRNEKPVSSVHDRSTITSYNEAVKKKEFHHENV
jgi:hypothetical protein